MEPKLPPEIDQADASAGGRGAPPEPEARNQAPAGLTREYRSESISVLWFADRCIHSAECIRALPRVFNPRRRPWVAIDAASADAIAEAVLLCPTGALHYVRHDGGPQEPESTDVQVRTVPNGPYHVRGLVEVTTSGGDLIRRDTRMALCRCGRSEHMPFCDNSHRAFGFRDPALAPPRDTPSA
jgi:uncharacterized Fe-S cluster protein YjdI/CDGSH-type Zn-finger protein